MFASEPAQEDFDKKFPAATTNPPYLQRSISAPAIAENVSDAILPTYNYDVRLILNKVSLNLAVHLMSVFF